MTEGVLQSLAPSTRRSYTAAAAAFLGFSAGVGESGTWPAHPEVVQRYLVHLRERGLAPRTIQGQLAAITFFSKVHGFPDPCTFRARRAIEGWKRSTPRAPDSRRPITFEVLAGLTDHLPGVCKSHYEAVMFQAAFTLAFFGALRVGEIVANSKVEATNHPLDVQDISVGQAGVTVSIRRSKTDQKARGARFQLAPLQGLGPCPWRACKAFLAIRPRQVGPLFIHRDGSFLSRYQFTGVLRAGLATLGLPPREFGPHSFRIGAATSAAGMGLQPGSIRAIGRWRSGAYRSYIRPHLVVGPKF